MTGCCICGAQQHLALLHASLPVLLTPARVTPRQLSTLQVRHQAAVSVFLGVYY